MRNKRSKSPFWLSQQVKRKFRLDFQTRKIEYTKAAATWKLLCLFDEITAYSLVENHREKSITKQWPTRMDLILRGKKVVSIYFDSIQKCTKWCQAINQVLAETVKAEDYHSN